MKNFRYIFIAAILVFASCQREEMNRDVRIDVTFVAQNEAGTRTVLVNDHILWEDGDQVRFL